MQGNCACTDAPLGCNQKIYDSLRSMMEMICFMFTAPSDVCALPALMMVNLVGSTCFICCHDQFTPTTGKH